MRRDKQHRQELLLQRIGELVRVRRRAIALTQEELAQRAGLHRTYVTDIESGIRNPALLTVVRIASALEVPVWQLIRFAEDSSQELAEIGTNLVVP